MSLEKDSEFQISIQLAPCINLEDQRIQTTFLISDLHSMG